MAKFTENLWNDLAQEHGAALAHATRPSPGRARRTGLIAGSTLALAAAGTALGLGLTSTSGSTPVGSTAAGGIKKVVTTAYTITEKSNGSVLVTINQTEALPQANQKLTAMGIHEQISIDMASGPASISGPMACTPAPGVSGPPVKVLVGTNGTDVIASGNTGAGTWHLGSCEVFPADYTGNSGTGNTGDGGAAG
jgi:hypothetical protein